MLRLLRRSQPPAAPVPAEDPAAEDELVAPAPPVPSTPPAPPLAGGATYVDRYRGTEWDTGFAVDRRGPDAVSALVGLLTGAIAFAALVTLWILLGSPVPS
jgi:hypothetical protein